MDAFNSHTGLDLLTVIPKAPRAAAAFPDRTASLWRSTLEAVVTATCWVPLRVTETCYLGEMVWLAVYTGTVAFESKGQRVQRHWGVTTIACRRRAANRLWPEPRPGAGARVAQWQMQCMEILGPCWSGTGAYWKIRLTNGYQRKTFTYNT